MYKPTVYNAAHVLVCFTYTLSTYDGNEYINNML